MSSSDSSGSVAIVSTHQRSGDEGLLVRRTLLLGLLLSLSGGLATGSSSRATSSGSAAAGADVHEEILDILALESLFTKIPSQKSSMSSGRVGIRSINRVVPWRRWKSRWARRPRP